MFAEMPRGGVGAARGGAGGDLGGLGLLAVRHVGVLGFFFLALFGFGKLGFGVFGLALRIVSNSCTLGSCSQIDVRIQCMDLGQSQTHRCSSSPA